MEKDGTATIDNAIRAYNSELLGKARQKIVLYDIHPGFGGAMVPLPTPIKKIIDKLEGNVVTLDEVVRQLRPIANRFQGGNLEIDRKYKSVCFNFIEGPYEHSFLLARYKKANEDR